MRCDNQDGMVKYFQQNAFVVGTGKKMWCGRRNAQWIACTWYGTWFGWVVESGDWSGVVVAGFHSAGQLERAVFGAGAWGKRLTLV